MKNNMTNPCGNLKKYGLPATLVGILAEHPATSGKQDWSFQVIFCCQHPRPPQLCLSSMTSPGCSMTYPANPNRPSSTGIGLSMCQDLQLNSAVFTLQHHLPLTPVGSTGVGEVWIHWKRLQLRRFACLLHCSRGAPRHILWHGMFHTAFDRNIANSKAEFEVKPLQSRPKLALDTSTAKLRFNVNSLYLIVNVLQSSLSFDSGRNLPPAKKLAGSNRLLLWKRMEREAHLTKSTTSTGHRSAVIHQSADIPSWGRHQSPFW